MENIPGYDEWKTTPPDEPEVLAICWKCGEPIFNEKECIEDFVGHAWCEDCLKDMYEEGESEDE